ncbi:hypothetical protein KLP28_07040 [Nocardioidaceae bacterium]|nr:hypothetical protein KLP28_07040 [Nocardioidaceae bacterium]
MSASAARAAGVPTAPVVAAGLLGGYSVARYSGVRPAGGAVLAVAGGVAWREWHRTHGGVVATGLLTTYVAGFGLSHPLARKLGAWPSVLTVTACAAGVAHVVHDRRG